MTRVFIYRDECFLHADGHSGFDIEGKDVVCAAISTLTQTFAKVGESMQSAKLTARPTEIEVHDGELDVRIFPKTRYKSVCQVKLDTIIEGLMMIQAEYPKNLAVYVR